MGWQTQSFSHMLLPHFFILFYCWKGRRDWWTEKIGTTAGMCWNSYGSAWWYTFISISHITIFYIMTHHIILCQCEEANCAHSFCQLMSQDNPAYFKKDYLDKLPYPIRKCVECHQEFGTMLKVGNRSPVWACVNAIKRESTCVYAVCNNCIAVKRVEEGSPVKRARGR